MKRERPSSTDKRHTVKISQDLWERLHVEAAKQEVTATGLINRWLEEKLKPVPGAISLPAIEPEVEANPEAATPGSSRPIWEEIAEVMSQVPEEDLAALPTDLAEQHDHYLYGTPKR